MTEMKPESIRPLARGTLRLQSDERLLKLFRRGIEPAFDELVNRYRSALVGYASAIAGHDRGEDVVQDSLVKAHRSLLADRDIEPRPWLYSVVRNTALNDVRDNRKHRHDDLADSARPGGSTDDLVEQRERFALVLAAVADLPPAQRRALVDHELSGFSHEEIAAELDLSTGATKQLIYRARVSLRNAFGAMIPIPLIAWLAEGSGVIATGAAGTGATATGLIGSIGGGSAAKLAVVAVVAGGSLAGGIAAEKHESLKNPGEESVARAASPSDSSVAADDSGSEVTETTADPDSSGSGGSEGRGKDGDDDRANRSGERESEKGEDRGSGGGDDGSTGSGTHGGGGQSGQRPEPEDRLDGGSGRGGEDRPSGSGQHGSGGDDRGDDDSGHGYRPPSGDGGSGGSSGSGGHRPDGGSSGGSGGSGGSSGGSGGSSGSSGGSSSGSGGSGGSSGGSGSGHSSGDDSFEHESDDGGSGSSGPGSHED